MSIITRERLQWLTNISGRDDIDEIDGEEIRELARIALASLEAEPVAYTEKCEITNMQATGLYLRGFPDNSQGRDIALYTAPPAPGSVPDDVSGPLAHAYKELTPTFMRNHIDVFERYGIYPDGSAGIQAMRIALDGMSRRAAMLQGAEPVSIRDELTEGWAACSERMPETDGNYWGWWSESKRQGPVWFIKSELQAQFQSSEITHWMPLPAAPQPEESGNDN